MGGCGLVRYQFVCESSTAFVNENLACCYICAMFPSDKQVRDARELLRPFLRPTRLIQTERIGRDSDTRVFLKLESDLPTGSFKARGALYALLKNVVERAGRGVGPGHHRRR